MVTPRVRRSVSAPSGDLPDNSKPVELVVDENTIADVVEEQGNKRFSYQAKVVQNEKDIEQDQDDDYDDSNDVRYSENQIQPQPKTNLDRLFEDITDAIAEGAYDGFYAKLDRMPDSMSDHFNVPCRELIELGVIQFSSIDRFNFINAIQEYNNNSGGRFSVRIFDYNQKELTVFNRASLSPRPIGAILLVQNPTKKAEPIHAQSNNGLSELGKILEAMHNATLQSNQRLLDAINAGKGKSTLEEAIERKVIQDMLTLPQNNNTGNLDALMMTLMGAPQIVDGIARKWFPPEPPPPTEPDMIDKIGRIAALPVVQSFVERVTDIADGIAAAKLMQPNGQGAPVANPNQSDQQPDYVELEADEMTELTNTILNELTGQNPIDASNAVIQSLSNDYADQFGELADTCKALPFDNILALIIGRLNKQNPAMLASFMDVEQTNQTGQPVWAPEGEHLKTRLNTLYEYLRNLPD